MMMKKCLLVLTASFYLQLVTNVWTAPLLGNLKLMRLKAAEDVVQQEDEVKLRMKRSASKTVFIYARHTSRFVRVTAKKVTALASSKKDKYAELILTILNPSVVSIKGKESNKYICMNHKGNVVLKDVFNKPKCLFQVLERSGYDIFRSVYNQTWHLGFKKNGAVKHGHMTRHHHHAAWMVSRYS